MYKPIAYVTLGIALLGTASCGGKNHCAEDYQRGGVAAKSAMEAMVLSNGTIQEIASNKRVPLDTLLEFNEFEPGKDPQFGDTVCVPVTKRKFGLLNK